MKYPELKKKRMEIPELPHDVVINILAKLPVKTLFMFKTVCSSWRKTIQSPHFARLQASSYEPEEKVLMEDSGSFYVVDLNTLSVHKTVTGFKLSPKKTRMDVYSSNGVLLLVDRWSARMVLWNPATGKYYKHVPYPPDSDSHPSHFYGFWYDDSCNEFRILKIRSDKKILVLDSNSSSWKTVGTLPRNLNLLFSQLSSKAFIHGGFHMAAFDADEKRYQILCLSPEGKVIRAFEPPSEWYKPRAVLTFFLTAKVWEGRPCLQALAWTSSSPPRVFEYWIMEEYGRSESWKKVFSVKTDCGYSLRSLLQNGRQLWVNYNTNAICVKDGDSDNMNAITSSSSSSPSTISFLGTCTYTPTLLFPNLLFTSHHML